MTKNRFVQFLDALYNSVDMSEIIKSTKKINNDFYEKNIKEGQWAHLCKNHIL
jgi:hypothetical protein